MELFWIWIIGAFAMAFLLGVVNGHQRFDLDDIAIILFWPFVLMAMAGALISKLWRP